MNNDKFASNQITGYMHPGYAASLAEFGTPLELPKCGGWILERKIPGTSYSDAMGCYPLFACKNWSMLGADLQELESKLISLSMVTDPFARYTPERLATIFNFCTMFKDHYITDLTQSPKSFVRETCRKYAISALKEVSVEHCTNPEFFLMDWIRLYSYLIKRHHITGIRSFSEESFRRLFNVPGVEMFIARLHDEIIGAEIWFVQEKIGYSHLMAISPLGYERKASYALVWVAIQHFSEYLHWLDHGSGAGINRNEDGLALFKRGWATGTRPVYFCGRIFNKKRYEELAKVKGSMNSDYFPAYRSGEFS
jgi:hypothetical protein